jgi:hypothetical protein
MASPDVLQPKSSAIEADSNQDRDIGAISAKDFLNLLDKEGLGASSLSQTLPEKKKLELYSEPEWTKAIKVKDLVRVLKTEKKKVELELPIDFGQRVNPPYATLNPSHAAQIAYSGGGSSYPNPDDPGKFPWPVEIRKASLDHRFDLVTSQIAQLTIAMQEIKAKIDHMSR